MAISERSNDRANVASGEGSVRSAVETVLLDLSERVQAQAAFCTAWSPDGAVELIGALGFEPAREARYLDHQQNSAARSNAALPWFGPGNGTAWQLAPYGPREGGEIAASWAPELSLFSGCRAWTVSDDGCAFVIELHRLSNDRAFAELELAALKDRLQTWRLVFDLLHVTLKLKRELDLATAALDRLPTGVVFANRVGGIFGANLAAREIIAEGDGLEATSHGLRTSIPQQSLQLRSLMQHRDNLDVRHLALERPSGLQPLQLSAHVVHRSPGNAVIFISDRDADVRIDTEALMHLFGLTQTEARLTALLAEGYSPEEAAAAMEVKVSTIRTHMGRILSKTGTRRQPELLSVVVRSLASLRRPETLRNS